MNGVKSYEQKIKRPLVARSNCCLNSQLSEEERMIRDNCS